MRGPPPLRPPRNPPAHFLFTAFRLRPPAILVAAARPFFVPPAPLPSRGVVVPLLGTSELAPDPSSDSSSLAAASCPKPPSIVAPSRLATFLKRPVTRDRNHVLLIDGATAVSLSTGSRLPSASS